MASMLRRSGKKAAAAVAAFALVSAGAVVAAVTAQAAGAGSIETGVAQSAEVGEIDYAVYLPPGYEDATQRYASVYLLHGRGDSLAAWQRVSTELDDLINAGKIQPMIVIMPDAPWNDRGNWYTDSQYTGTAASGKGLNIETAITRDLVDHVDATYRTVDDRQARAIGGYSMGGAGALQMSLGHQELFSAGLLLSTAAYNPQPPLDSSARDYGAYGVGDALYDEARYLELSYPTGLKQFDPALPLHLFIAVGDDEWANPDPANAVHDLDFASAQLYNQARRVPGITAELRVLNGGHDWDVWEPAFVEGIIDLNGYLRTEAAASWGGELLGTSGDDRAGGLAAHGDGSTTLGLTVGGQLDEIPYAGAMDVIIQKRDDQGVVQWSHPIGTAANERNYGVVAGADGTTITAGYTRGDLDGKHPSGASDDAFVAAVSTTGERLWTTQFGSADKADRIYGLASGPDGGVYVTGYSSGVVAGDANAGDKDVFVALLTDNGEIQWINQFGGPGEDKGNAVAPAPEGGVYVAGIAGGPLPDSTHMGSGDGFVGHISPAGELTWLNQFGSAGNEQVSGLVARPDGTIVAIGHTKGTLGAASSGDNDAFAKAFGSDGKPLWTTQFGTDTDDRGVTAVAQSDGSITVVGTTYGQMGTQAGGVDVFTAHLAADGTLGEIEQFGSNERDGADEWDDANLFATAANDGMWITGLTFGAPTGLINSGAGDIFVEFWVQAEEPSPEPTGEPTDEPTNEPTGEPTAEPTSEPTGAPSEKPTPDPTNSPTDEPTSKPVDQTAGQDLAETGTEILPYLGVIFALVLTGAAVLARRGAVRRN